MKLLAPAKLNLFLKSLRRREDGYHDLSMLMEKISLCDEIFLEKISNGIELVDSLDISKEKNLVFCAAKLLLEEPGSSGGVRIHLTKKIPMGGGLGGGSSDAAAVLKGLNQLWNLHWPVEKLAEIGVKLGADVPFFLYDGPAKVEGIGEKVTPVAKLPKLWIILINPGISVSTPWAYQAWDDQNVAATFWSKGNRLTQENQSVSVPPTFEALIKLLHNDFEAVVFPHHPEIEQAKEMLLKIGADGAMMSGSGATVFGLFETKEKRDRAFKKLMVRPHWQMFTAQN